MCYGFSKQAKSIASQLLLLIVFATTFIFSPDTFAKKNSDKPDTVLQYEIISSVLNEQRDIFVMLPDSYNKSNQSKFDVIYVLSSNRLAYNLALDKELLSRKNKLPPSIIVSIPNINSTTRQRDLTPPFLKQDLDDKNSPSGQADKFLDYIAKDVTPFIKANYPTSGNNVLVGHSRAGLLVFYSLLYNPNQFSGRIALSPALWREDNLFITKLKQQLPKLSLRRSYFYLSMGDLEVAKMKHAFDLATVTFAQQPHDDLLYFSHYQPFADHSSNHFITAATGLLGYYQFKGTQ